MTFKFVNFQFPNYLRVFKSQKRMLVVFMAFNDSLLGKT